MATSPPSPPTIATPRLQRRVWLMAGMSVALVIGAVVLYWTQPRNDPATSFQRGLAALAKRDVPALHREIQILKKYPKYQSEMQLLRGMVFLEGNDLQSALQQFDLCSIHPATRVDALILAGETFCKLGRQLEAMGVLQQALRLKPNSIGAHRMLAVAYYDTGSNPLAVTELRKVAELDPKDYRPHRLLGLIHLDHEQFGEAVQDYRACLRLAPPPAIRNEVLIELSRALVRLHRYQEALKFLDQSPETADVFAYRAECHYSLGAKAAARAAALKAIRINPTHLSGLVWLGTVEFEAGQLAEAAEHLELAVKSHPQDFSAPYKLAGVYQRMGRTEDAKVQMKRMEENRKLREKFTDLHEQANKSPQDAQIRYELGQTATKLQLLHLARMWYQAALALNPQHARAKQALQNLKLPPVAENAAEELTSH